MYLKFKDENKLQYRPLPNVLTIKESPIDGLGLFATARIFTGHIIGTTHVLDFGFPDNVIRTALGGFINHSDEPNCILVREGRRLMLKTAGVIRPDDELTLKYGALEDLSKLP
tara:strand:- start:125 stop:463 length:339 start_codon:yes stop_codon:yes gene_type:complete